MPAHAQSGVASLLPGSACEWRPVLGWEGVYEAGSGGRIRNARTHHVLASHADKKGYHRVSLKRPGFHQTVLVHRTVLLAFSEPTGPQARHLDGDPSNNRLDNLGWGTQRDNEADKFHHGTSQHGERNKQAKLTQAQVLEIFNLKGKARQRDVARKYGVCDANVSNIWKGLSWGWLTNA